jgi:hypothetical protein
VKFVVKWECWIVFPFTLLFFLPGFPSFFRAVAMILFLSTRYQNSGVVRAVVQTTLAKIDGKFFKSLILKEMSKHPSVPTALKAAYDKARSVSMNAFKYRQSPVKNDKNE